MKYHINETTGYLHLTCTPEEQAALKVKREANIEASDGNIHFTADDEPDELEHLICNSELEWLPEGSTGDLTSAPMLGIMGVDGFGVPNFGEAYERPIIGRWAYMGYQVRSFLDDLAESGESIWEGGFADPEAKPEVWERGEEIPMQGRTFADVFCKTHENPPANVPMSLIRERLKEARQRVAEVQLALGAPDLDKNEATRLLSAAVAILESVLEEK